MRAVIKKMGIFGPPNIERMKAHKDLKGLIKVMRSSRDGRLSAQAARALGQIGDASVVDPLLDEFWSNNYYSTDLAAAALIELAGRLKEIDLSTRLLKEWIAALEPRGLIYSGGSVHYDGDDDEFNREWAKEDQSRLRSREIWDMGAGRRQAAARALGELGDARAVDALIQSIKTHHQSSYDDHTRRFAVEALNKIGVRDPRVIQLLQEAMRENISRG
jgi:HEAT repeat protein